MLNMENCFTPNGSCLSFPVKQSPDFNADQENSSSSCSSTERRSKWHQTAGSKCNKKKTTTKKANRGVGLKFGGKKPHQVARRNERERKRVQQVNNGYELLASTLTNWEAICGNRKLTKAETLKAAILYIRHLEQVLCTENQNGRAGASKHEAMENCWTATSSPSLVQQCPSGSQNQQFGHSQQQFGFLAQQQNQQHAPAFLQSSEALFGYDFF